MVAVIATYSLINGDVQLIFVQAEKAAFHQLRLVRFFALGTEFAHQALGDNADDVARDDVGQYADIEQAWNRSDSRVGMQGGIHLVAGHGGAESHFCRIAIADFADQNDVRVLPHHGSDAVGKIHLRRLVDRGLADHVHGIFDWILQRHDVDAFGIDVIQDRIQRGGFTATGWAGDQDDAVRSGQHEFEQCQLGIFQSQLVQRHDSLLPVENTQYDVLAVGGGLSGNTKVDGSPRKSDGNSAILRGACFGDVHVAHHLETYRHRGPVGFMQAPDLA